MGVYTSDQTKKGWLTSILELGAWVGTMYSGFLAEILSRKYAILINTAVFIIGVIVQCTAAAGGGSSSILGGRFITGKSFDSHIHKSLTKSRYGRWRSIDDCTNVQCRSSPSGGSRSPGWVATTSHHLWYIDQFLD